MNMAPFKNIEKEKIYEFEYDVFIYYIKVCLGTIWPRLAINGTLKLHFTVHSAVATGS